MSDGPQTAAVAVVGAGPAGLMAALFAAENGASVILLERNPEAGRKLLLTGSGRCNVTNRREMSDFIPAYYGNGRFLYPAFRHHSNLDTIDFFTRHGVQLLEEADGKLFPASGMASDVRDTLLAACRAAGVRFRFSERVLRIEPPPSGEPEAAVFRLVTDQDSDGIFASTVILATGGLSYPATGSMGDGLRWAETWGVDVTPVRPALAPLTCSDNWVADLAGVSVDPVQVALLRHMPGEPDTQAGRAEGALLFTHRGVSGPAILRVSRNLPKVWAGAAYSLDIDLLPAESREGLDVLLTKQLMRHPRRGAANALDGLLPASLLAEVFRLGGVDPASLAGVMPRAGRHRIGELLKHLPLNVSRPASYGEAMATAGGIARTCVNPRTMEVTKIPGLYVAGELIDIDGDTGGFNLQAAFSTGALAGSSAAIRAHKV